MSFVGLLVMIVTKHDIFLFLKKMTQNFESRRGQDQSYKLKNFTRRVDLRHFFHEYSLKKHIFSIPILAITYLQVNCKHLTERIMRQNIFKD